MQPNPLLKKLGLADDDRAMIIHADDIGTCQASLAAYADLLDDGLVSSASVMTPGAWFPATAMFCRGNADRVDMGVHVTLTSEHAGCRWAPLSTRDPATGLLDAGGYFHSAPMALKERAAPEAVQLEIRAQVERALAAGIDVTHIDTHEFTVGERPAFFESYVQVALEYGIPPLLVRGHAVDLHDMDRGSTGEAATGAIAEYMSVLEAQGLPVLDSLYMSPLITAEGRLDQMRRLLAVLSPGISVLIFHPARNTPELHAFATDWPARVADYVAFRDETMRTIFQEAGVHVIGWRVLRDLMRAAMSSPHSAAKVLEPER
jgi:predicted glycoside hydrolase/deacetylase ChbG (UPF0249 family)